MKNFKYVAVVRLLEDFNQKDYCFALYEEDYSLITSENTMVVVNARNKNRRILGIVKNIIPVEEYNGANITAQVVAVVNEDNYNARIAEEERLKDIAKKKADIERELEEEINKRKTFKFYEKMAEEYKDNPRLAELVKELKDLSV